jgi:hypothetical protein
VNDVCDQFVMNEILMCHTVDTVWIEAGESVIKKYQERLQIPYSIIKYWYVS